MPIALASDEFQRTTTPEKVKCKVFIRGSTAINRLKWLSCVGSFKTQNRRTYMRLWMQAEAHAGRCTKSFTPCREKSPSSLDHSHKHNKSKHKYNTLCSWKSGEKNGKKTKR